jgi:hypothetical protein
VLDFEPVSGRAKAHLFPALSTAKRDEAALRNHPVVDAAVSFGYHAKFLIVAIAHWNYEQPGIVELLQ